MTGAAARRVRGTDALLALLAILIAMAELAYSRQHALRAPTMPQLALMVTGAGALILRRRHPRAVAAVAVLCGTAFPFAAPHDVLADIPSMVALYTVASRTDRRRAVTFGAAAAILLTASSVVWLPDHFNDIHNLLPVNYVAAAVAVGDSVRNQRALLRQERRRAAEAEQGREAEARRQVREERIRIARDLHDVVAHHITLVNAQAGVAHHLMRTDPDRAYQALAGISETSRAALDELRATVGLLRSDDEPETRQPAPSFERLDELLSTVRRGGFEVEVTRHGAARPLTPTADVAAYRIIQEALTNAGKHGTGPTARLGLTYAGDLLRVEVTNEARAGRQGPGTGHGMIGMRERAESAGGRFHAGLRADGVFVAGAELPLATG